MLNQIAGYFYFLKKVPKTGKLAQGILYSVGLMGLISACQSPPPQVAESPKPSASAAIKAVAKKTPKPTPKPTKPARSSASKKPVNPQVTLSIFRLDNQCNKFVAEKVALPRNSAAAKAVARVIEGVESADLDLAGYRFNLKGGTATIDFRLPAGAKRPLSALSNCEQLALYGSLRKTLMGNSGLKIKSVQFTDRGRPIKP